MRSPARGSRAHRARRRGGSAGRSRTSPTTSRPTTTRPTSATSSRRARRSSRRCCARRTPSRRARWPPSPRATPSGGRQQNLCVQHIDGCAGDVRFYDWDKRPGNIRRPLLWTARSGATISGHVWQVAGGPARKPGVVITNGSVQAPEQLYWAQAAALARAGYVVLTWDPQTQGRSDGPGGPGTESENRNPQTPEAFTEGTVDALDFFLSTPARAVPAPQQPHGAVDQPLRQARSARARGPQRSLQPAPRLAGPHPDRDRGQLAGRVRGVQGRCRGRPRGRAGGLGPAVHAPSAPAPAGRARR